MQRIRYKVCKKKEFETVVQDLNNITYCELLGIDISGKLDLFRCNGLSTLIVRFASLTDEHFSIICNSCKNLKTLDIIGNEISDYSSLEDLKNLECFKSETSKSVFPLTELLVLGKLKKLRIIMINHHRLQKESSSEFWIRFKDFQWTDLQYFIVCQLLDEDIYSQFFRNFLQKHNLLSYCKVSNVPESSIKFSEYEFIFPKLYTDDNTVSIISALDFLLSRKTALQDHIRYFYHLGKVIGEKGSEGRIFHLRRIGFKKILTLAKSYLQNLTELTSYNEDYLKDSDKWYSLYFLKWIEYQSDDKELWVDILRSLYQIRIYEEENDFLYIFEQVYLKVQDHLTESDNFNGIDKFYFDLHIKDVPLCDFLQRARNRYIHMNVLRLTNDVTLETFEPIKP